MEEKQYQDLIRAEVLNLQKTMAEASPEDRVKLREDLGKLVATNSEPVKGMITNEKTQQDAAEFLTPVIDAVFAGHHPSLVSQVTIQSSDYPQPTKMVNPLPMPAIEILNNKEKFSDMITNFQKTEELEGYKAVKTGGDKEEIVEAKKSLTLTIPNECNELIFSIKRFDNNLAKIDKAIDFDELRFNDKTYHLTAAWLIYS